MLLSSFECWDRSVVVVASFVGHPVVRKTVVAAAAAAAAEESIWKGVESVQAAFEVMSESLSMHPEVWGLLELVAAAQHEAEAALFVAVLAAVEVGEGAEAVAACGELVLERGGSLLTTEV